ncbi:sigma-70 family RNA polymerase sigma factor [Mucilaginibacter endophyticus]|uniref:sigma-70 family RNA polymerase sigma factor n=1 Tax=Mucilaginibacter endophyticus TaxID=2675003 RepID=UPI000E0D7381|nr:sigma-70 family RNA polymerase sigma factor [Mucilaginibacter endophyticus]
MSYSTLSDSDLLIQLRLGKKSAYTEIYNRYWKRLLLAAWNHSRDEQIAQDIVQEVLIDLWEKHHAYEIENLCAFLMTAVKFKIFKNYQKENRRNLLAKENYNFKDVYLEEQNIDARFLQQIIDGIVEEMPERCRLVFHYSRNMGLKNEEIANQANITKKTVENTLNRSLKIIRAQLKNLGIPFVLIIKSFFYFFK